MALQVNSVPLSETIEPGLPRRATIVPECRSGVRKPPVRAWEFGLETFGNLVFQIVMCATVAGLEKPRIWKQIRQMLHTCTCGLEFVIVPKEIPLSGPEALCCEDCGREISGPRCTRYADYVPARGISPSSAADTRAAPH
jgi:hypothetical protein